MAEVPMVGRLEWIGLRPAHREPVRVVQTARALRYRGLEGDRRAAGRPGSSRQVSLIQAEHLEVVARLLRRGPIDPARVRRNLVVSGVGVAGLVGLRFRVGEALLEGAKDCAPCSRMRESLGPGGYHAMRGHGGIVARVIEGGTLRVGDEVRVVAEQAQLALGD
ncbi:MAG: MOSC domain-containing protein [Myxococcota bacterium]